jgi:hypothetical protein
MAPPDQPWRRCLALQDKEETFLAEVGMFLDKLEALSADQRQSLALFKAAELMNALIQIREQREDLLRVGPEQAKRSFDIVRAVIRNRLLPLVGGETVDLRDPALQAVIDEGCRLFHLGKTDSAVYQRALALSAAQCIALHRDLDQALMRYVDGCGFEVPPWLFDAVTNLFIDAYSHEPSSSAS